MYLVFSLLFIQTLLWHPQSISSRRLLFVPFPISSSPRGILQNTSSFSSEDLYTCYGFYLRLNPPKSLCNDLLLANQASNQMSPSLNTLSRLAAPSILLRFYFYHDTSLHIISSCLLIFFLFIAISCSPLPPYSWLRKIKNPVCLAHCHVPVPSMMPGWLSSYGWMAHLHFTDE